MYYTQKDAQKIAANEIWHSMQSLKGCPVGIYYDCRYLWFLEVI